MQIWWKMERTLEQMAELSSAPAPPPLFSDSFSQIKFSLNRFCQFSDAIASSIFPTRPSLVLFIHPALLPLMSGDQTKAIECNSFPKRPKLFG